MIIWPKFIAKMHAVTWEKNETPNNGIRQQQTAFLSKSNIIAVECAPQMMNSDRSSQVEIRCAADAAFFFKF